MHLYAKRVSAVASGDYYQVIFDSDVRSEDEVDPFDKPEPYLLVQNQFEFFNGGKCHLDSDDEEYIGDFKLKFVELTPTRFVFEIARRHHNHVEICFELNLAEFEEVRQTIEIIFGIREPTYDEGDLDAAL